MRDVIKLLLLIMLAAALLVGVMSCLSAVALAESTEANVSVIDLTDIITAVLALIAALITRYVIPWIKEKTTLEQQKRIQAAIDTFVFAAEKVYGAGNGEKKKLYVLSKLHEKGFNVNTEDVRAGIEAAVMALDMKKNVKPPDDV